MQAVHGGARRPGRDGAARVPIGRESRCGERGGRRGQDGERGCVFIAAPRFLFSVRWQLATPFFGKISAEPCARHDGLPLLRGCPPVGFMNEPPCRPGHLQDTPSTYLPYSALPVLLGIHHNMGWCQHLFLKLCRALAGFHSLYYYYYRIEIVDS